MLLTGKTQQQIDQEKNTTNLIQEMNELQKYLDSTDWYITRKYEREIAIPENVSIQRIENINRINEIKVTLGV